MKIPVFILTVALASIVALETWTLSEIVALKVSVAAIQATLNAIGIANH